MGRLIWINGAAPLSFLRANHSSHTDALALQSQCWPICVLPSSNTSRTSYGLRRPPYAGPPNPGAPIGISGAANPMALGRSASWFFQLCNVGLDTPNSPGTRCLHFFHPLVLVCLVRTFNTLQACVYPFTQMVIP